EAFFQLKDSRQAVRDYSFVVQHKPSLGVYNDRALAEEDLGDYQAAVRDFTSALAFGCSDMLCYTWENGANAYLTLKDYSRAVHDLDQTIKNYFASQIFGFGIEQFRQMYPEYDDMADDVLAERLRVTFMPEMTQDVFKKHFLVEAEYRDDFIIVNLWLK